MNQILLDFFAKFLLPGLLEAWQRKHSETGVYPTLAEAKAVLETEYVKNKSEGLAFLAENNVDLG